MIIVIKKFAFKISPQKYEIDLLAINIDGNDYHIINELSVVNPRVIVLEYNAKFIPSVEYVMKYHTKHHWNNDDMFRGFFHVTTQSAVSYLRLLSNR